MTTNHSRHIRTLDHEKDSGLLITMPDNTVVRLVGVEDTPGGASRVLTVVDAAGDPRQVRMSAHTILTVEDPYDDLI